MANIDDIRDKCKVYIRDISYTDEQLDAVILNVFEEIASDTRIFQTKFNFQILKDTTTYDIRGLGSVEGVLGIIDVLEIYDEYNTSAMDIFSRVSNCLYEVSDDTWLSLNNEKFVTTIVWTIPQLDDLDPSIIALISTTIVSGVKFYLSDLFKGHEDSQVTNYDYMRFFQKKEELLNKLPLIEYEITDRTKQDKWI